MTATTQHGDTVKEGWVIQRQERRCSCSALGLMSYTLVWEAWGASGPMDHAEAHAALRKAVEAERECVLDGYEIHFDCCQYTIQHEIDDFNELRWRLLHTETNETISAEELGLPTRVTPPSDLVDPDVRRAVEHIKQAIYELDNWNYACAAGELRYAGKFLERPAQEQRERESARDKQSSECHDLGRGSLDDGTQEEVPNDSTSAHAGGSRD